MSSKKDISNDLRIDEEYVKGLADKWDYLVTLEKIGFNGCLLKTMVLDPHDGRLPFFLIFNQGREIYIKNLIQKHNNIACPFCSESTDLKIADLPNLVILPNKYPCLPHQYVMAPREHTDKIDANYISDAMRFGISTGFKVYCNSSGSGGAYTHLTFQASGKHPAAPNTDFFDYINGEVFAEEDGLTAEVLHHTIFGVRLICNDIERLSSIISKFIKIYDKSINLVIRGNQSYIFPRTEIESPSGFGGWKFGALEAIGIFICQNDKAFEDLDYKKLEEAMKEISVFDSGEQQNVIKIMINLIEEFKG